MYVVREVSVTRPLLLTGDTRIMIFVLATFRASEAQRASWKGNSTGGYNVCHKPGAWISLRTAFCHPLST